MVFERYALGRLAGNALFSSSAVIRFEPLPSMLCGEFSVDMMNISRLFSRYKVCSFSDSLYKTTANKIFSELTGELVDLEGSAVGDMISEIVQEFK